MHVNKLPKVVISFIYVCGTSVLWKESTSLRRLYPKVLHGHELQYNNLADISIPWYCLHCDSLNRSAMIYDIPIHPEYDCHSSVNSSGMINSSKSTSVSLSPTTTDPPGDFSSDMAFATPNPSNSQSFTSTISIGSPALSSSPKLPNQAKPSKSKKSLRILNVNFRSARKKASIYLRSLKIQTRTLFSAQKHG
ncbi:hypothetical protein DPMN_123514 [Dreissena polymorpha]|uniref:Uncharacterized protein n=1 Tax=Dreissena polymorpha TaxID=45954 RepID=A0A9D4GXM1_DREPO|nr:hypothetical protein DPMN_123514 [Dreissena polymorpha]